MKLANGDQALMVATKEHTDESDEDVKVLQEEACLSLSKLFKRK